MQRIVLKMRGRVSEERKPLWILNGLTISRDFLKEHLMVAPYRCLKTRTREARSFPVIACS
jgi:hypothetical protein